MKLKTKIILGVMLLLVILPPTTTHAFQLVICGSKTGTGNKVCTAGQLLTQAIAVVNFLIDSAAFLAIAYVLYAGVSMILARGNSAKFESARTTLTNAITGLVIVLLAYIIVSFVIAVLTGGKPLEQFLNFLPK